MKQGELEEILKKITGFDWDRGNADKNWKKHKVKARECEEVFHDQPLVLFKDEKYSGEEKRYGVFGITNNKRRLTLVFTIRRNKIRVISARDQSKSERKEYEKK